MAESSACWQPSGNLSVQPVPQDFTSTALNQPISPPKSYQCPVNPLLPTVNQFLHVASNKNINFSKAALTFLIFMAFGQLDKPIY